MSKIFFSDLDATLLYSKKQLKKYDQVIENEILVETFNNAPLSFMSPHVWNFLGSHAGKDFVFVPTTTRTFEQYDRIVFPEKSVSSAIVLNGARIFLNGKENTDWTRKVDTIVDNNVFHPTKILELLENLLQNSDEVKMVRDADGVFVYVVCETKHSPYVDSVTKALAATTGYVRSKQGRKTYLIPAGVSKGSAVAEVSQQLHADVTVGSGDSVLDFTMIPHVSCFLHPQHGDKISFLTKNVEVTLHKGIEASDEIIDRVQQLFEL